MSPFEALYGRKCTTPISWDNPVDKIMTGNASGNGENGKRGTT
jgi:hypothetical protein